MTTVDGKHPTDAHARFHYFAKAENAAAKVAIQIVRNATDCGDWFNYMQRGVPIEGLRLISEV